MYVYRYCVTPPTEAPRGVNRIKPQTIILTSDDSKYIRMKVFNPCDGEEEYHAPGFVVRGMRYLPIPNNFMANVYLLSHMENAGSFYYRIVTSDKIPVVEGPLVLNPDYTFQFSVEGLPFGKYYLEIHYKTKYSHNRYTFPLIVNR